MSAESAGERPVVATIDDETAVLGVPWENRLADLVPLSPAATGLVVFAALFGAFLLLQWALGEPVLYPGPDGAPELVRSARLTFLVTALVGFSAGANMYLPRAIWRDQCESLVEDPERRRELLAVDALRIPMKTLRTTRRAGLAGVALSLGVTVWFDRTADPDAVDGSYAFLIALNPLLFWMLARSAFASLSGGRDATLPLELDREIDLFDLRPYYCRGRVGLRLALVWFGGTATALAVLATTGLTVVALSLVVGGLACGAIAFVLPVQGFRRRVRAKKRAAIDALQPELARVLDAHRRGDAADAGRLADLLALKTYVEDVREWPFDNTTLWRFAFYTLIPIGSWIGGALVERIVGAVLGGGE